MTSVTSEELTPEEISEITTAVTNSFEVDTNEVNAEVAYISTGSLEITVDVETSEDEFIDAVAATLAELLDIHPRDVTITSVNLENGEIEFEVASEMYDDASTIQSNLDLLQPDQIEDEIQTAIPSAQVVNVVANDEISADVTIIVDGSNGGNINDAKVAVTDILNEQGFDVNIDVAIVTAKPTASPTFTTMIPSAMPSITGIVVTLTLTTDEVIDIIAIEALEEQIAIDYGVNMDDVTVDTTYSVTGTIEVDDVPDDMSVAELQEVFKQSIADVLDVHTRDVEISIDSVTGEVMYIVSNEDDTDLINIQNALESPSFANALEDEISHTLPMATISRIQTNDEIQTELIVTVDATESTANIEEANDQVVASLENDGFSAESQSKEYFFKTFTFNHKFFLSMYEYIQKSISFHRIKVKVIRLIDSFLICLLWFSFIELHWLLQGQHYNQLRLLRRVFLVQFLQQQV